MNLDLNVLLAAIQADPACAPHIVPSKPKVLAEVARAGDQAIADIINASSTFDYSVAVPAWQAKKLLIKRGKWRGIVLASQNPDHPAVEAAYAAVALAEDARLDADFLDASAGPLVDALVATGLMSAQDKANLQALSRCRLLVTAADVSRAVRGPME